MNKQESMGLTSEQASDNLRRALELGLERPCKSHLIIKLYLTNPLLDPRRVTTMKPIASGMLGAMLLCGGLSLATAQEMAGTMPPPKVLVVDREFLKPGKGGGAHEKTESAFVQAFARAKWPTRYLAMNSVSGKNRTLFFIGYDSFEAWEKDNLAQQNNPALSAALDRAGLNDGDLLSEADASVLVYNEEQSLRAPVDIAHMRYFEISLYRVRAGHRHEWNEA